MSIQLVGGALMAVTVLAGTGDPALASPADAPGTAPDTGYFEPNRGQTDPRVRFLSRGRGYVLYLTPTEAVLSLAGAPGAPARLSLSLVGANPEARVTGEGEAPGRSHYFLGRDPRAWRADVPHHAAVRHADVYPGIDMVFHRRRQQLEYDFVVAPGADPGAIRLRFDPVDELALDESGGLVVRTGARVLTQPPPELYQVVGDERRPVRGSYLRHGGSELGFAVTGDYDRTRPLVIDPILLYSSYLGGSESDWGFGVAVGYHGEAYVVGHTASLDFPVASPAPVQPNPGGGLDAIVAKINKDGTGVVWATYLGGSADELGLAIAADSGGRVYVTGQTQSVDFPVVPDPASGSLPLQGQNAGGADAFVAKIDHTGGVLSWATYLGGSGLDEGRGVAVDLSGRVYVGGRTESADFPTVAALQPALAGLGDAFVARIAASGTSLDYSTYLGGSGFEHGRDLAIDGAGSVYLVGGTTSTDFPVGSPDPAGPAQPFSGGNADAFVAKIELASASPIVLGLAYGTYLGGNAAETGIAIAVDPGHNAYVTGETGSVNYPTTVGAAQTSHGGGLYDAFVTKLNALGSQRVYSSYLGGSQDDFGNGIAVTLTGLAYVAGSTHSAGFPVKNSLQAFGGSTDAFVTLFTPAGDAHVFSTFLGGSNSDTGLSVAVGAASGAAVVTGRTNSSNFPSVTLVPGGPFQPAPGGAFPTTDAFVAAVVPYFGTLVWSSSDIFPMRGGDAFQILGTFRLAEESDGLAPDAELVRVVLGAFVETLSPGAMRRDETGYVYRNERGGITLLHLARDGRFTLEGVGHLGLTPDTRELDLVLQVGNDLGRTRVPLRSRSRR